MIRKLIRVFRDLSGTSGYTRYRCIKRLTRVLISAMCCYPLPIKALPDEKTPRAPWNITIVKHQEYEIVINLVIVYFIRWLQMLVSANHVFVIATRWWPLLFDNLTRLKIHENNFLNRLSCNGCPGASKNKHMKSSQPTCQQSSLFKKGCYLLNFIPSY